MLKDDARALRHGTRGARFFLNAMAEYYFSGDRPIGPLDIPREDLTDEELAGGEGAAQRAGLAARHHRRRSGGGARDA